PADTPVGEARLWWRHSAQRVFPVVDRLGYAGMFEPATPPVAGEASTVGAAAAPVPFVRPTHDLERDTLPLVARVPGRAVAVVDENRVVGIVRLEDVEHLLHEPEPPDLPTPWNGDVGPT